MEETRLKALAAVARKAWAQRAIRKLTVVAAAAALGWAGIEASDTSVEAVLTAIVLVLS